MLRSVFDRRAAVAAPAAAILAACALAFSGPAARAESPDLPDPVYRNLRYTDDFSRPDPNRKPDFFDPIKHIPLADGALGATYLSLGGELRERFENYNHINFGFKAPNWSNYELHRLQLNADLHLTDFVRAFIQFGEMDRQGRRGVTSTTDIDRGDIMQAFVDVKVPGVVGDTMTARYGREEMLFGFQRLIAVREGPNVRRAFNGFRFTEQWGEITVDAFRVKPVVNNPGGLDDNSHEFQQLEGVYISLPVANITKADFYWLGYENDIAKFRGLTGQENRDTFGTRLFKRTPTWDWNVEASKQSGRFRTYDIEAYMLAGIVGYTFQDVTWQPRIAVSSNYASGDDTASKTRIGTFNALYPRLPYFAETSMLVPSNVKDIRPVLELHPMKNVLAVFGYDALWRASRTDGLYGSGLQLYSGTNAAKVKSGFIGQELTADVRWQVDQHLQLGFIAAEFLTGPAVREALGKDVTFLVGYAKYKF